MQIADLLREVFGFAAEMRAYSFRVVKRWKFISEKLDDSQSFVQKAQGRRCPDDAAWTIIFSGRLRTFIARSTSEGGLSFENSHQEIRSRTALHPFWRGREGAGVLHARALPRRDRKAGRLEAERRPLVQYGIHSTAHRRARPAGQIKTSSGVRGRRFGGHQGIFARA